MSRIRMTRFAIGLIAGATVLALVAGCSAKSPTAPEQVPAPVPGPSPDSWTITVTISPSTLFKSATGSGGEPATVEVRVRKSGSSETPKNGTTVVLSATLGEFNSVGSGLRQVVLALSGGNALAQLYPGDTTGTVTVSAQLEGSVGQALAEIRDEETLFLTGLSPDTGGERGGTRVTIEGLGITEPLRVFFGNDLGDVAKVAKDGTFVRVDTPRIFDPLSFFDTEACDSNGDGSLNGVMFIGTRVDVTVEIRDGAVATSTLTRAFTYLPSDRSCQSEPNPPFVLSVDPSRGPQAGGQTVTITGDGFNVPLRVFFQDKLAEVVSASSTKITVVTPPGDVNSEACEGPAPDFSPGTRNVDTPVKVQVESANGATETLDNAYTYEPTDTTCVTGN